jgi:hypothetical protein
MKTVCIMPAITSLLYAAFNLSLALAMICLSAGCTATPPKIRQVSHDPILSRQAGVLLLVDACVQRDGLGTGDYFVINEAEAGARAALGSLQKYIRDSGIPVRAEVVSVGGARLNTNNSPILVADRVGGAKRLAPQPLKVSGLNMDDSEYIRSLGIVSTYAFERAAVHRGKKPADNTARPEPPTSISMEDFRAAAEVIKSKTQASSVLFLGVLGNSRTAGKAAAQFVGGLAIGVGVAYATAGLGTGFYLVFIPGHQLDGMIMEGALIDLESGQLTWSNAVRVAGDPVNPKAMANPEALDLLFHDIMFKPVDVQPEVQPNLNPDSKKPL